MLRLTTALFAAALSLPSLAGEGADITVGHLYAGTAPAGITELENHPDAESRFGKGLLQFAVALQNFGQSLYRHGYALADDARNPMLISIPLNPNPEPLDYDQLRTILTTLTADLDVAGTTLREASVAGEYVIALDVMKAAIDIDGDGVAGTGENIGAIVGPALGLDRRPRRPGEPDLTSLTIGLDRADAFWLAGYSNIVAAQADFLLAHDFAPLLDTLLPHFFPNAGIGLTEPRSQRTQAGGILGSQDLAPIVDLVAAIHTTNWPVVDRERLKSVQARLKAMTALSRGNWQAILAETDNDRELIPGPKQTNLFGGPGITDEQVTAWLETLGLMDDLLDGRLLVPHWRFARGLDLNAYFETATRTDPVMLLSGHDAIPFLRDGPVMDDETFAAAGRAFGGDWLGYAFWFN